MLLLAAFALAQAAAPAPVPPVAPREGGICVGLAWVPLGPGEQAWKEDGPDFAVYRFSGPKGGDDRWWGVYTGSYPQVEGNGPVLVRQGKLVIHRAMEDGKFRGYIAEEDGRPMLRNHFFGSIFAGTDADKAVFARMDFAAKRQRLCDKAE